MTLFKNSKNILTKNSVVCLLAGICCLLWGSAFPCIKIGYTMFHIASDKTVDQMLFAGIRFTLAGILVLLFSLFISFFTKNANQHKEAISVIPKSTTTWKHILILSLFQTTLQYFFFYVGLAHTSGVKASIIEGTNVFVAILIASLIFRQEKLSAAKLLGCLLGFAGVVLINLSGNGLDFSMKLTGEGFIFFSTIAYAFSSVIMKQYSKKENPVILSGWQFVFGGITLMAAAKILGGTISHFSPSHCAMLLYLAFISAGAYSLWGILLKYNPVSKVSVYGFMNPVFGVFLSCILLRDNSQSLGIHAIIALVLVCAGIYVVNRFPAKITAPEN